MQEPTVERLMERHNQTEGGFTKEMTFDLGLELESDRSWRRWGGGGEGVRACQEKKVHMQR